MESNQEYTYTTQDVCVICGKYLPEGYGMVCKDCQEGNHDW